MGLRNLQVWREFVAPVLERRQERRWLARGRQRQPPAWVKRRNIMVVADVWGAEAFVETGTFKGDTVAAVADRFDPIVSIELHPRYAAMARRRFAAQTHVRIIEGDSAVTLADAVAGIDRRILFWLDGHCVGEDLEQRESDTPIAREIDIIFATRLQRGHSDIVMVDDAHCFDGTNGYPPLASFMGAIRTAWGYSVHCVDDCIFSLPRLE